MADGHSSSFTGKTVTSHQPSAAFNPRSVSIDWEFLAALSSARDSAIHSVAAPPDGNGSLSNAVSAPPPSAVSCFEASSAKRENEAEEQHISLARGSSGEPMPLHRGGSLTTAQQPPLFQRLSFGEAQQPAVRAVERSSASHLGIFHPHPSRHAQLPVFHRAVSETGGFRDSNSMHLTSSTPSQKKRRCQVDSCRVDLTNASTYCKRRKICETCIRSPTVLDEGRVMRYCQQCSKLHDVAEFDGTKRSCRRKLRRVAERRGSQS